MMISNTPSLTISKNFYLNKYNYISNYLKGLDVSQSHNRVNIYNNIIYRPVTANTPVTPYAYYACLDYISIIYCINCGSKYLNI